jgi:hypothetical protein
MLSSDGKNLGEVVGANGRTAGKDDRERALSKYF